MTCFCPGYIDENVVAQMVAVLLANSRLFPTNEPSLPRVVMICFFSVAEVVDYSFFLRVSDDTVGN